MTKNGSLAIVSRARRALAEAKTLDDILGVRDMAEAARQLLKVRGESFAAQNEAAEVKIRAERMLGESIGVSDKKRNQYAGNTMLPALSDLGISKMQSHRWQRMASVPDDVFTDYVRETIDAGRELTSKAIYKLGKAAVCAVPIVHTEPLEDTCDDLQTLIDSGDKYGTVYADPPWQYDNSSTRANVEGLYAGTMSVDDVCAMPVEQLAADDAHCHLWTTNAFLRDAFRVLDAWGFEYRSVFVWVKPQMGIGNYWRVSHEFLLLGIRGNAKRFERHDLKSWGEFDRGEHSAKPEAIRGMIEQVSPGPHLELFGRQQIPGWMVFGNQVSEQRRFA